MNKIEPYLFVENSGGDKISLNTFIKYCEDSVITDDDGFAGKIIMNDFVVAEITFYPSDMLEMKNEYLLLQKEKGKIEIVWYNK